MRTVIHQQQLGFTLVETLIYLALLSVVLTGGVVTAVNLLSSTTSLDRIMHTATELQFVSAKLDWLLSDGTLLVPAPGSTSTVLRIDHGPIVYELTSTPAGSLILREGDDIYELTNVLTVETIEFVRSSDDPRLLFVHFITGDQPLPPRLYYVDP